MNYLIIGGGILLSGYILKKLLIKNPEKNSDYRFVTFFLDPWTNDYTAQLACNKCKKILDVAIFRNYLQYFLGRYQMPRNGTYGICDNDHKN